jgi:hypothetical protein
MKFGDRYERTFNLAIHVFRSSLSSAEGTWNVVRILFQTGLKVSKGPRLFLTTAGMSKGPDPLLELVYSRILNVGVSNRLKYRPLFIRLGRRFRFIGTANTDIRTGSGAFQYVRAFRISALAIMYLHGCIITQACVKKPT